MDSQPNLFEIATSELSQDAFITWLIKWADDQYSNIDRDLNQTGKNLLLSILELATITNSPSAWKVETGRHWEDIDIWVDINKKYFIVIEDKKDSCQHDNQLDKYKKIVNDYYKQLREIIFVYFKTGNESSKTIKDIKQKGWLNFNRDKFLQVLKPSKSNNNILIDFRNYLEKIDNETKLFRDFKNLNNRRVCEGLYLYLQEQKNDSDWNYISNKNNGFLGFWYHSCECSNNANIKLYLQIENGLKNKPNLFIKICGEWTKTTNELRSVYKLLEEFRGKKIEITKPNRFRAGENSSVALISNAFIPDLNEKLDLQNLLQTMRFAEEIVNEVIKKI